MRDGSLSVLVVEDSSADAELLRFELEAAGLDVVSRCVATVEELRAALAAQRWDVILSDYSMPGLGAATALEIARQVDADVPFIVVSGTIGEQRATAMMRAGANDYFLKGELSKLGLAIEREMREAKQRRAHREVHAQLALLASIVSTSDEAIVSTTIDGAITSWNPAAQGLFGWQSSDVIGKAASLMVHGDARDAFESVMIGLRDNAPACRFVSVGVHADGHHIPISITMSRLTAGGQLLGLSSVVRDITQQLATESALTASRDQLETAQRIAHVGSWSSGFLPGGEVELSRECAAIFGIPARRRLAVTELLDMIHPEDRERFRIATRAAIDHGTPGEIEHRLLLADGTVRWVLQRGQIERASDGTPLRFVGSAQDVTARRLADERLRASETEFRLLAEAMPQIVWITDATGANTYFNRQWMEYTGMTLAESLGSGWLKPFHPDDAQRTRDAWQKAVDGTGIYSLECRLRRADGAYRWWLIRGVPVKDASGAVHKWFGTCTDIDTLKQGEDRLRVLNAVSEAMRDREGLPSVLRIMGQHLEVSGCVYLAVAPDGDHVTVPAEYLDGRASIGDRHQLSSFGADLVAGLRRGSEPFVVRDVSTELVNSAAALRIDVGAFMVCSLLESGVLRALVAVHQTTARAWTEAEISLFDEVVQRCWADVQRREAERRLRDSEAMLRIAGHAAHLGGWTLSLPDLAFTWSDEVCLIHEMPTGSSPSFAEAVTFYQPEHRSVIELAVGACTRDGTPFDLELQIITVKGRRVWVRAIGNAERNAAGQITLVRGAFQDIDDRRKLQDQFRQAQKMEAIGRLAGGVAHDFNNLLTVILSYANFALEDLPPADPMQADLREIHDAALRAATLTKQLLAFSRQQVLESRVLDLNEVIKGMERLLARVIGEDVQLALIPGSSTGRIYADAGQIEQVIMNLAVNARDAMPDGGTLTIEVTDAVLVDPQVGDLGIPPGTYVAITISDSGVGMDAATQARIFEPFFTTKGPGRGTGLGLSTVFGIVAQSGGHVRVASEVGVGTSFTVYMPRTDRHLGTARTPGLPSETGTETILLVEDDDQVRAVATTILRRAGYHVLGAANGEAALALAGELTAPIHLLLTDVVMPGMNGRKLAEQLAPRRPEMRILFASGYTDDAIVHHGVLDGKLPFIQKPFTSEALLRRVREVLGPAPSTPPTPIA